MILSSDDFNWEADKWLDWFYNKLNNEEGKYYHNHTQAVISNERCVISFISVHSAILLAITKILWDFYELRNRPLLSMP